MDWLKRYKFLLALPEGCNIFYNLSLRKSNQIMIPGR
jgi:hypothetical protein